MYKELDQEIKRNIKAEQGSNIIEIPDEYTDTDNNFVTFADVQYYDDNVSLRTVDDQISYMEKLITFGPKYGIHVNKKKSVISINRLQSLPHRTRTKLLGLFNPDKINEMGNIQVIGVAAGTDEFAAQYVNDKLESWEKQLELIDKITDLHIKYHLAFRFQSISKANYITRNMPLLNNRQITDRFEQVRSKLIHMMLPFPLTPQQLKQAELACQYGGLNCRKISQYTSAARLSTLHMLLNSKLLQKLVKEHIVITQQHKTQEHIRDMLNT